MTTIDNIMALADNYATLTADTAAVTKAREAMRTALDEALAQPAREPLTIQHLREIERNHVYNHTATLIEFARQIERAHGIGGDK